MLEASAQKINSWLGICHPWLYFWGLQPWTLLMHTKIIVISLDLFCWRRQGSTPCLLPARLQSKGRQQKAIRIPTSVRLPAELGKIALVMSEIGSECPGNFTGGHLGTGEDGPLEKRTTAMGAGLCTPAQPAAVSQVQQWPSFSNQCPVPAPVSASSANCGRCWCVPDTGVSQGVLLHGGQKA